MALGDRFSSDNRLSSLLKAQPDYNNGSVYGGLAHVLQQALLGYEAGQDGRNQQAALAAMATGMGAKPWTNPDTGQIAPGTEGGYDGAISALGRLQNNQYAGRLASELLMGKTQSDLENASWQKRFDAQSAAEDARLNKRLASEREIVGMKIAADRRNAEIRAETAGKYYAVPTGSGTMLLDKGTGMAIMLGVDENGQPVQIGSPFRPSLTPNGQPLPIPQNAATPTGDGQPQPPTSVPQPSPGARPLMPPSIDPAAQEATRRAQKIGENEGERIGTMPERASKAQLVLDQIDQQHGVIAQEIDRAIDIIKNQGVLPAAGIGSALSSIPATNARNLASTLDTIKGNIGFDKLQAMREASPTGGALGQVSDFENRNLQAVLGSLDQGQSPANVVATLQRLKGILAESRDTRRAAFARDFGGQMMQPSQPQQGSTGGLPPLPPGFQVIP